MNNWTYWTNFFPELFYQIKNNPHLLRFFFWDFFSGNY